VISTSIVRCKEGKRRSKSIFGFITLNGNGVVMLSDSSKSDDFIDFLEVIRKENPERPICIVLDNARTIMQGLSR